MNAELAQAMLDVLGCEAQVAANGQEAVDAAARTAFDLVLMDCQMPVLDGFAATAAIRRREQTQGGRRVPVVAITANVIEGVREECVAAGMDDYLSKPFTQQQLAALLDRWLPAGSRAAPPAALAPLAASSRSETAHPRAAVSGAGARSESAHEAQPEPDQTHSPLARQVLAQVRALQRPGQPDLLGKIVGIYLQESPRLLQQMRDAVDREDGEALRRAAHSLKSSSANLGATELAALSKVLEHRGREGRLDGAGELLQALEAQYCGVQDALTWERENGLPNP